jgi:carbon-monoxide dehydrogenase small subunit
MAASDTIDIKMIINGTEVSGTVEGRTLLVQFIRDHIGLTGTHVGCDTSQCGCCTLHMNGVAVKSCTILAAHADGAEITTIEGLADGDILHPMQEAFRDNHALQCGYCTPGMVMSALAIVNKNPDPTDEDIRHGLEGNLCRCTGYHNIVKAVAAGAKAMRS